MSRQARVAVVNHPNAIFRTNDQRNDFSNVNGVRTELVALVRYMLTAGLIFEVTAVMTDHGADGALSPTPPHCGTHQYGWALDCWPLAKPQHGAYLDPSDPAFQHFLATVQKAPYLKQIGLAGTSYTPLNVIAAGASTFHDEGPDHVHIGSQDC
jgi:hypothetical protein